MKVTLRALIFVMLCMAGYAGAAQSAPTATVTIVSRTEAEGMVKVDDKWYCALPNHKTCTVSALQPGYHKFEFVFIDVDAPGNVYPVKEFGTLTAGQHRTMEVDTDGAVWK